MSFASMDSVGLGLRVEFLNDLLGLKRKPVQFLEVTPENWMRVQGSKARKLHTLRQHYPMVAHGLSLSIGGPCPLNYAFIEELSEFFQQCAIDCYSEHLSFCSDEQGYFHDLLPIPFTHEAVEYVSKRIKVVQDRMKRPIALENSSYYYAPGQQISEIEFIKAILNHSDSLILLDVNNVYVNSVNHDYDPYAFIRSIPSDRIAYLHIAGHVQKEPNLIIDTHSANVVHPVWDLLRFTYEQHGLKPTVLERDSNIPPLCDLLDETQKIIKCQNQTATL